MNKYFVKVRRLIASFQEIHELVSLEDSFKILTRNKSASSPHSLIKLKIRRIGFMPVVVREGTSDYTTLKTTFLGQYHLPHKILPDNSTILDLGCNVGYTVLHFAYLYPKAQIIGVEMDFDNFKLAQKNTGNIKNITLLNKAISISSGVVSYNKNTHEDAYQINHRQIVKDAEDIRVESITINSVIEQLNIKCIDYLKMDIEGEEVRIFNESLSDLSWLNIVDMLNIEIHTNLADLERIISILENHNFVVWREDHHWSLIRAVRS